MLPPTIHLTQAHSPSRGTASKSSHTCHPIPSPLPSPSHLVLGRQVHPQLQPMVLSVPCRHLRMHDTSASCHPLHPPHATQSWASVQMLLSRGAVDDIWIHPPRPHAGLERSGSGLGRVYLEVSWPNGAFVTIEVFVGEGTLRQGRGETHVRKVRRR